MIWGSVLAVSGVMMLIMASSDTPEAYKIIVNPANPASSLSRAELSRLFLDAATWDNGQPVMPVDLSPASPLRELFSKAVHGMPAAAVAARRANASAGSARTPVTLNSDADVIQYVRLKLGAIAYVSAAANVSTVKVVAIDWTESRDTTGAASRSQIDTLLSMYATALERRDMAAVKRLWPTINGAQMVALRAEFDQARTLRVELLDPQIDVNGDTALVTARRRNVVMTTSGTTIRSVAMMTLRLRNAAGRWAIEEVRHTTQ